LSKTKLNIKKILLTIVWVGLTAGSIVLLVAAVQSKNARTCKGIEIEISGVSNNFFIDKQDVLNIIKNYTGSNPVGKTINSFSLGDMENSLEKDVWVKNAELFFDNNEILRVTIDEREPVARIFSLSGKSFYIDSSIRVLPLSDKFSARLPVFTGYANNPGFLSKADSSLLTDIKNLSIALQGDSFLMAMIDQVDITLQRRFEMIPKIGNQLIVFGNADDAKAKFEKLKLFYKNVISTSGFSKYSIIDLQYKNQVVAKIKDAADKTSDSLRSFQLMQMIAERMASQAADSTRLLAPDNGERGAADTTMIQQSVQRDETETENGYVPANEPEAEKPATVLKPATSTAAKTPVKKPETVKKPVNKRPVPVPKPAKPKPRAVMQKPANNEY
jgi:cell division protein FtsQ